MGPNLLGPIKSAGVLALDDAGLIMRVKFKTKPGVQFVIQRQVFRRLKELFKEKGLEFATRDVMVRLPDEPIHEEPMPRGKRLALRHFIHRRRRFPVPQLRPLPRSSPKRKPRRKPWRKRRMPSHETFITVFMDLAGCGRISEERAIEARILPVGVWRH